MSTNVLLSVRRQAFEQFSTLGFFHRLSSSEPRDYRVVFGKQQKRRTLLRLALLSVNSLQFTPPQKRNRSLRCFRSLDQFLRRICVITAKVPHAVASGTPVCKLSTIYAASKMKQITAVFSQHRAIPAADLCNIRFSTCQAHYLVPLRSQRS